MAYTRHTWQSGEVISSALLNNIEDGIEEAASSGVSLKFVKDSEGSYEEGGETITYTGSVIEGMVSDDIPEEYRNKATGTFAHAEGGNAYPEDNEYYPNTASGKASHAEGSGTTASGAYCHAEGLGTTASGDDSHAEGSDTTASGFSSHAEGNVTIASGSASHAEGNGTTASMAYSHAEGNGTTASGDDSHAEGSDTTASGDDSHAEGSGTTASSACCHAEGWYTTASGFSSHAEGDSTIANHNAQHVFGAYNIEDPSTDTTSRRGTYIEIVGNGTNNNRSNARTLDWSGNEVLSGTLTATGITIGSTSVTEAQLQSLLALLNT